ncbi:hypothetical protein I316_04401 [Kwoniella heveanensis BCC8398]|uniref:Integral membrane protein n=1 Tax=Kwoniella heveanensis BCC8398 TaxID=1296120 RepID=A0A1B9GSK8_9TREE|nr:hypothetical protein I316_04401 [Kwoniella heveanensis BCC8398]
MVRFASFGLGCLVSSMLLGSVSALSSFEYLQVTKDFADAFMPSTGSDLVASLESKKALFAEDVVGTVDIAGDINGRDFSTDFLFGLFLGAAQNPKVPSPIGLPISYNVTAAVVEHNTVSAGIKFELSYPILNQTFPIELEAFLTIDDNKQITQYDLIFRRWAWATDTIIPLLTPYMAEMLGMADTNSTVTLHQFLAYASCQQVMTYCNGTNAQYESTLECMSTAQTLSTGEFYRVGENNLACRAVHAPMLQLSPETYCPALGAGGGSFCTDRDYTQTVRGDHFTQGFLAPKYVTPENQKIVKDIWASSEDQTLSPLLEISMSSQDAHSWEPTFYATCTFAYFIFYYFFAKVTDFMFKRFNKAYKELPRELQKNVTMYLMTIVFTAVALALQLVGSPGFHGEWHYWEIRCVRLAGVLTVALYIFELVFRFNMRLPLVAHHVLTIFAISLGVTTLEYTQNPCYMLSGIVWLFQATTEQPTFVGLMGYRLKWRKETVAWILKISSIQTFVFKAASAVALLVYWGLHQNYTYRSMDIVWTAFVWIIAIGLFLTQIWGSYVTYIIGVRILRKRPVAPERTDSSASSDTQVSELTDLSDAEKGPDRQLEKDSQFVQGGKYGDNLSVGNLTTLSYDGRQRGYQGSVVTASSSMASMIVDHQYGPRP